MIKKKETRRRTKKKKSSLRQHRRSVVLITAVLVLLTSVVGVSSVMLQIKNNEYKQREAKLESQIKEEKERSKEVASLKEYIGSDDFIKDVAEEKLGLVSPNEIIFKPTE